MFTRVKSMQNKDSPNNCPSIPTDLSVEYECDYEKQNEGATESKQRLWNGHVLVTSEKSYLAVKN
jgi:hypothetical protein